MTARGSRWDIVMERGDEWEFWVLLAIATAIIIVIRSSKDRVWAWLQWRWHRIRFPR